MATPSPTIPVYNTMDTSDAVPQQKVETKQKNIYLSLFVMVLGGIAFGFALNKAQIHMPQVIIDQMIFRRENLMKMFIAALGASFLSTAIFHYFRPTEFTAMQTKRTCQSNHILVLIAGGIILGMGMTIAGACPGSIYVQLGAAIPSSPAVFGGILVGTIIVGLLRPKIRSWQEEKPKIDTWFDFSWKIQAAVGAGMLLVAILLEVIVPEPVPSYCWYPALSGFIMGALNLPLTFLVNSALGATTSFTILLSPLLQGFRHISGLTLGWIDMPPVRDISNLVFCIGIVGGSALGSWHPSMDLGPMPTVTSSWIGGILIGLGANVAAGCTSGHGLSGTALLMKSSFIVLPCIYAGAIGTALIKLGAGYL